MDTDFVTHVASSPRQRAAVATSRVRSVRKWASRYLAAVATGNRNDAYLAASNLLEIARQVARDNGIDPLRPDVALPAAPAATQPATCRRCGEPASPAAWHNGYCDVCADAMKGATDA